MNPLWNKKAELAETSLDVVKKSYEGNTEATSFMLCISTHISAHTEFLLHWKAQHSHYGSTQNRGFWKPWLVYFTGLYMKTQTDSSPTSLFWQNHKRFSLTKEPCKPEKTYSTVFYWSALLTISSLKCLPPGALFIYWIRRYLIVIST